MGWGAPPCSSSRWWWSCRSGARGDGRVGLRFLRSLRSLRTLMTLMFLGRRKDGGCPSQGRSRGTRDPIVADAICVPPLAVTRGCAAIRGIRGIPRCGENRIVVLY